MAHRPTKRRSHMPHISTPLNQYSGPRRPPVISLGQQTQTVCSVGPDLFQPDLQMIERMRYRQQLAAERR